LKLANFLDRKLDYKNLIMRFVERKLLSDDTLILFLSRIFHLHNLE
jgi:hypothetical protein